MISDRALISATIARSVVTSRGTGAVSSGAAGVGVARNRHNPPIAAASAARDSSERDIGEAPSASQRLRELRGLGIVYHQTIGNKRPGRLAAARRRRYEDRPALAC